MNKPFIRALIDTLSIALWVIGVYAVLYIAKTFSAGALVQAVLIIIWSLIYFKDEKSSTD